MLGVTDHPANVAYHEVDLPDDFIVQFHHYIPNVYYSSADVSAPRSDVHCVYCYCCSKVISRSVEPEVSVVLYFDMINTFEPKI